MLILKPIVHETIWGGKKLTPYSWSSSQKIGHLYSVFQSESQSNEILNGTWKGRMLSEYFAENKARLHLEEYAAFPVIIALVEAADHLSIQVHPDDQTALRLEGIPRGKNESWYFIEAPHQKKIFNGCICKTKDELISAIKGQRIGTIVDFLSVEAGDYVYVEAGTLHAMSAGSLVYEIEENVEITYRFYDFDRVGVDGKKRPLQMDRALESVHIENKSIVKRYKGGPIHERLYVTQIYENIRHYTNESDTIECMTILDESVFIKQENMIVRMGQTILLEPGEVLNASIKTAVVARPKADMEDRHES